MIPIRHYLLLTLVLLFGMSASAQQKLTFRIADFELAEEDMTARNPQYEKIDPDGARYAIIKVSSDNPEDNLRAYKFDFGYLESFVEMHDDILWLYVRQNAKKVSIRREGYTAISQYNLGQTIQQGRTYRMLLSAQMPVAQYRILQFKVTPADEGALVKVRREGSNSGYELWGEVDMAGSIDRRLELDTYYYEVTAENYEKCEGRIVLINGEGNHVENVTLKPNFGWLEIDDASGIAGAEVYVDNKKIGTIPYKSKKRWEVRDGYQLMISNGELYKTYNSTFNIRKGEVTKLSPRLESDFAKTTIRVDGDDKADIYINGERRGTGTWTGPLKAGSYVVESRRVSHRTVTTSIVVKRNVEESFVVAAPKPIIGTIYVTTQPSGAQVYLDGVNRGQSPVELKNVLIGQRDVRVMLDNYKTEEQTVDVKENNTTEARFVLRDFARFTIDAKPQAHLTLNGEDKGKTPYSFDGASGNYDIQLTCKKYQTYHRQTNLRSSSPDTTFQLRYQYQHPYSGYVQVGAQVGTLMAFAATVGGYIHDFNVEASFLKGLSGGKTLYWHYTGDADVRPISYNYKPTMAYGLKVGYGFTVGNRLRLTPQVGGNVLSVKSDGGEMKGYALSAAIGLRADYAVLPYLGLFVGPEMNIAVKKSDTYKQLTDVSSTIKHWGTGFNARLGICFFF